MIFAPLGTNYRVRLTEVPEKTEGGIFLPECLREQGVEAEVLAVGPGAVVPDQGGARTVQWVEVGNVVLFQEHHFRPLALDVKEGIVRDEDLLARVWESEGEIEPLNDWVRVAPEAAARESAGGLALPEDARRRECVGRFCEAGPGKLRFAGPLAGTRREVEAVLHASEDDLFRRRVWWDPEAETVAVGAEFILVKATDLVAWEE